MTLISRNKIIFGFGIFTIAFILLFLALFLFQFFSGHFSPLPISINFSNISLKNILFNDYTIFPIISIIFLGIYTLVTTSVIRYSFGKTQSPEIIFFFGFLVGCLLEYCRLFIPIYNLWNSYSTFVIFIGKTCFACRLISLLCFLFSALFSADFQNQQAEKNLLIITIISLIFAEFLPINTGTITPAVLPASGFNKVFTIILFFIFFITCISMIVFVKSKYTFGYIFLMLGYFSLIYATNLILCLFGIFFLTFGTVKYLEKIHNYYLWQ